MTTAQPQSILHRMVHRPTETPSEVPLTSSRAVRMAMTRAADEHLDMAVTVLGMAEETLTLDALLAAMPDGLTLIGMIRGDGLYGVAAVDAQLRAAIIEMQTMGCLSDRPPEPRAATGTDVMLVAPLVSGFLTALNVTTLRTDLEGWTENVAVGDAVANMRAAGLALHDRDYRLIRLTLDLGVAERQGEYLLALPSNRVADLPVDAGAPDTDWPRQFHQVVCDAPATLEAILHRFHLPLHKVDRLAENQIIPLPGCNVGSVRLTDPNGKTVARAKLGQFAGMRAVRIEADAQLRLTDLPPPHPSHKDVNAPPDSPALTDQDPASVSN